jgi:hypothetical protein
MPDDKHRTRLLDRLSAAITRCHNPSDRGYKHYGLRGISVHDEWRSDRSAFLCYVQTLDGWDNPKLDMDRANNNGNYEPGNIRFTTKKANAANRRRMEELEQRIRDLETRLRHCKCGAAMALHDPH